MSLLERAGLTLLQRLDPEAAHGLALRALSAGLGPRSAPVTSPRLATVLAGMALPNPLGIAAGFDKNAQALGPLLQSGFGFVEVGATTPLPQPGNPRPRLFRLPAERGVINRFGFNNDGAAAMAARLAAPRPPGIVGLNLGANKDSADRIADFVEVLGRCGGLVDFVTVNVSSPNTANLRDLQGKKALWALMAAIMEARAALPVTRRPPVFLKIAPDLHPSALDDVAEVALHSSLSGVIATNTTVARDGLTSPARSETGGLSGAPLFSRATAVLGRLYRITEGKLPLIGVGGIFTAEDAFAKLAAGATALQLYSALAFEGLSLGVRLLQALDAKAEAMGLENLADIRGEEARFWAARMPE